MNTSGDSIVCEVVNNYTVHCDGEDFKSEFLLKPSNGLFWLYLCLYLLMVMFAGESSPAQPLLDTDGWCGDLLGMPGCKCFASHGHSLSM